MSLKITNDFWDIIRATPIYIAVIMFGRMIIDPQPGSVIVTVCFIINNILNWFIKYFFFKPIYKFIGKDNLPLIGLGKRPPGAITCGIFNKCSSLEETSFGMPSGHSQFSWTLAIYLIMKIWSNYFKKNKKKTSLIVIKIIQSLLVIIFAIIISYSRVVIEKCHTIQQVIIGGIIGCGIGLGIYYLELYVDNNIDKWHLLY